MRRLAAALAIVWVSAPALAGVTDAQIHSFLQSNQYWDEGPYFREMAVLYRAVRDAPDGAKVSGAAATLALRWKIPKAAATELIEGVIGRYEFATEMPLAERNRRYVESFRRATAAAPDSPELWG